MDVYRSWLILFQFKAIYALSRPTEFSTWPNWWDFGRFCLLCALKHRSILVSSENKLRVGENIFLAAAHPRRLGKFNRKSKARRLPLLNFKSSAFFFRQLWFIHAGFKFRTNHNLRNMPLRFFASTFWVPWLPNSSRTSHRSWLLHHVPPSIGNGRNMNSKNTRSIHTSTRFTS